MNEPTVSIIIPFYNPGDYFEILLESIAAQTYKHIQVVLVDDGSKSDFNRMAKNFVELASNRLLVTKKNGGVASARQAGLEVCTGDFIIHADADDFLPEDAIEKLVKKMQATNADVVIGGYIIKYDKQESYIGISESENYWGFVEGLLSGKYHGGLWNKLIKKELYNSIRFESSLNYMEDKLILAKIFRNGPYTISFLNEPVYYYRKNSGSVTYNLSLSSIQSSVAVVDKIYNLYIGCLPIELLSNMVDQIRAFEIYQSAKLGVNVYSAKDSVLLKNNKVDFRYKLAIWLASKDLIFLVKLMVKTQGFILKLQGR